MGLKDLMYLADGLFIGALSSWMITMIIQNWKEEPHNGDHCGTCGRSKHGK